MKNLKGNTVIVTAGGTREYIDDVRVLTNISSGKLGARIAEELYVKGANVIYIHAKGAVIPRDAHLLKNMQVVEISTVDDLIDTMQYFAEELDNPVDAVVMAIAASDFTFKRDKAVKLKSNDPQAFIDFMRDTITPNPKVITKVKEWMSDTYLVGFKFEVGQEHNDLIKIARESMVKSNADLVIANDKVEMNKAGSHIAYLVTKDTETRCVGKRDITEQLIKTLIEKL